MIAAIYARKSTARPLRVLLGPLGLLILATSASADCAWVLWWETDTMGLARENSNYHAVEWRPLTRLPTAADCYASLKSTVKLQMGHIPAGEQVHRISDSAFQRVTSTHATVYTYTCFPDTVDPRGPKGK
jgi:hypothetical protein